MMKKNLWFSLLSCLVLLSCKDEGEVFNGALCIEHVTTIDAKNGMQADMTVIILDGRIVRIENSNELKLSQANRLINGTDKYLIPGLWDAHVHFAYIEDLAPSMFDLFLVHGVTSVRDTGGKIDFVKKWKNASMKNPTEAPRVMIAGPLIDGLPNVYDGSAPNRPPLSVGIASVEQAIQLVDKLDSIGIDFLKAYEMLTPEQFMAITQRAREKGLKVSGHVPLSMDVISASNAGLNSMEHMRNLEMSTAKNANDLLKIRREMLADGKMKQGGDLRSSIHKAQRAEAVANSDEEQTSKVLAVLAKNQTWQIPTLSITTSMVKRPYARAEWRESFKYLPPEIEQQWNEDVNIAISREVSEFSRLYVDWHFDMVKKIHEANIGIMAGTDCPISYLTPGFSLHEELALLVKAGLRPLEALETATLNPAIYFEMENDLGLIREGMLADLVLLDANPLDDISNTRKINSVIKQGKLYSRKDLDKMLEDLDMQ